MSVSLKEKLAWCVFFAGLGGTLMFAAYTVAEGWGFSRDVFILPLLSIMLLGAGAWALVKLRRLTPHEFAGKWHLSIVDLLIVAGFSGVLLGIAKTSLDEEVFLGRGILICLLWGTADVCGLLIASRKNIQRTRDRFLFSYAYALRLFGALGTGALFVLTVTVALYGHNFQSFINDVLSGPSYRQNEFESGLLIVMRCGLICLPLGILGCWFVESRSRNISK